MEKEYEIFILPNGNIQFVYYDELNELLKIGNPSIKRVSHVDAVIVDNDVCWFADLCPVNGPKLGPFKTRDQAIEAELRWLSDFYDNKNAT